MAGFKKGKSGNPNGRPVGSINKSTKIGVNSNSIEVYMKFYESWLGAFKGAKYYVYSHTHNGETFYIGKGKGDRAWENKEGKRNDIWQEYAESIGYEYDVKILACDLTEREALAVEAALIGVSKPKCNIKLLFS